MTKNYGIENIEYLFPYEIDAPAPPPVPVMKRSIIVIDNPDPDLLPPDAIQGDAAISVSDLEVYSLDSPTISNNVKDVKVVPNVDPVPSEISVGDIVYDETTNDLYQVGE